jgi:hypothetical protein
MDQVIFRNTLNNILKTPKRNSDYQFIAQVEILLLVHKIIISMETHYSFVCLSVVGLFVSSCKQSELRVSYLPGRCCITWATLPAHFCVGYFQDKVLQTICPGWLENTILLTSASWVAARITGLSHQCQFFFFLHWRLNSRPHSHLLSRYSTAWATLPAPFLL